MATVDHQDFAAVLHDILAIQTKGLEARTNFDVTAREAITMLTMDSPWQVVNIASSSIPQAIVEK